MLTSSELALIAIVSYVAGSTVRFYYKKFISRRGLPANIPWIDAEDGKILSRARVTLRTLLGTRQLIHDGYSKYSKKGQIFVLPNITTGPEVILPPSLMDWLLQQPDKVLDQDAVNRQFLRADYTMLHPKVMNDTVHGDVIRKEMTKQLGQVIDDVNDEVDFALRKAWGVNTNEWTEICVYDSTLDIIGRVSLRVLAGLPLCRNDKLLENSMRFARLVVAQATLINLIPEIFRPIFAPFINMVDTRRYRKCAKYLTPIVKVRNSSPLTDEKKKSDYVQWAIDHSYINNDPSERDVDLITRRFNAMGFAAIQSSVITASNLFLDLAASPITPSYFETIRDEVTAELDLAGGAWSQRVLSRMVTLDSGLRETMRLWGFVSRGVLKEVVSKDGVTLPDGTHLPRGVKVGIHQSALHRDEDIYPEASKFLPLRFCTKTEEPVNNTPDGHGRRGAALVTTSATWLGFSHGKHACPGRFFAAQQLKLVLAYIAMNYEIEPIATRPPNNWLAGSQGPPMDFKIKIRRRQGTV